MKNTFLLLLCSYVSFSQKVCLVPPDDLNRPEPLQAFGQFTKIWPKDTFYVYFIDGQSIKDLYKKVLYHANKWGQYSDVEFIKTNDPQKSDFRISFNRGGSWSYVGLDNRFIPKDQPTMQLGWVIESINDSRELTRVIVHEFGHALGLEHEHNHPTNGIKWNVPVVYNYYARQGWKKADVDHNLFMKYSEPKTNHTEYDNKSIMHYPIPKEHTLDGYSVGWNRELSRLDKIWIKNTYGDLNYNK